MKKIIVILGIILTGYISNAQEDKSVPSDVKASLTVKYPEVLINKVHWEKVGQYYKADFKSGDKRYEVLMDQSGKWIHSDIRIKDLPNDVKNGLAKSEFKNSKINEVEKIEDPDMDPRYKVEVSQGEEDFNVMLDKNGKVIRKNKI